MSTPISAVQSVNPNKGVKRPLLGNPTTVPGQLPGFRGRVVDAGGPIKAPKLRNGNVNNETSNVRIPYSRVCPLEFLSSYQGRLGPGDVIFTHKYPPGFVKASAGFNNATLGVNTLSRVVGLDGLNRLLMKSGPNGWRLGENVFKAPEGGGALGVVNTDGTFKLTTLREYTLDGVVISNDEPGAFTSSGSRDNVLFNVAIQGPVETNNGFLKYEEEKNPNDRKYSQYNPLTGVINSRTVEAHARGSSESGMHIENSPMPGRVGNPTLEKQGKVDFVANYCGTYSAFPSQMFDRRVEILNTLYLGLRAYTLSDDAKRQLTKEDGRLQYPEKDPLDKTEYYFYQYLPFSSRAAAVIQAVSDTFVKMNEAAAPGSKVTRDDAAKKVGAVKQQTETQLPSSKFDKATYDPIRTEDMQNMVGAWRVGRVMDTKASVHDRYAGGPRDTAFSCMVDVGVAWRNTERATVADNLRSQPTGFLLPPSEGGYVQTYDKDGKTIAPPPRAQKSGQQDPECLANNLAPPLSAVIGSDFGKGTNKPSPNLAIKLKNAAQLIQNALAAKLASEKSALEAFEKGSANNKPANKEVRDKVAKKVRTEMKQYKQALELLKEGQFGEDPMIMMLVILKATGLVEKTEPLTKAKWNAFLEAKAALKDIKSSPNPNGKQINEATSQMTTTLHVWERGAVDQIKVVLQKMPQGPGQKTRQTVNLIKRNMLSYYKALKGARGAIDELREEEKNNDKTVTEIAVVIELEMGKFLNRVSHFTMLFAETLKFLNPNDSKQVDKADIENRDYFPDSTGETLLDGTELMEQLLHFSAMCDLHAKYIDIDDPRFAAPALQVAQAGPTAAPTGVAPVGATPAAAAGVKAPAKRGKTPTRARAAPTSAAAASSSSAPVPAAAAGVSSIPLVPTGAPVTAAVDAAPRRRARDTGESVTNSLFENMFKAGPTDSAVDEPASPTPSSGSEGPTSGPRTFRRQR